jgi:dTDP-4-dehydrorhamnose reductase
MNILVTGANGQLGNEMRVLSAAHPKHQYFFTDVVSAEQTYTLDICDKTAVSAFVTEHAIDLIVNCAAYTNVDKAEEDEATALKINAEALSVLGSQGVKVIHIVPTMSSRVTSMYRAKSLILLLRVRPTDVRSTKVKNACWRFVPRR